MFKILIIEAKFFEGKTEANDNLMGMLVDLLGRSLDLKNSLANLNL